MKICFTIINGIISDVDAWEKFPPRVSVCAKSGQHGIYYVGISPRKYYIDTNEMNLDKPNNVKIYQNVQKAIGMYRDQVLDELI